jgi:hypothetical protein
MRRPVRWLSVFLLLGSSGAVAIPRPTADEPIDLPIREVTIFSDRARVTRQGDLRLDKGPQPIILPRLPASVDPESVRVEASGAKIARVEVKRATIDEFPRTEAETLLRQLEKLRDEESAIRDQLVTLDQERKLIQSIRPTAKPFETDRMTPLQLEPAGWGVSLKFLDARESAVANAVIPLETQLRRKREEIANVAERARQLVSGNSYEQQLKVVAFVEGEGKPAQISLMYMAQNAVWRPSYDVRFTPGDSAVEIGFAAIVAQQTGEDWENARLTLSTAVPTTTATLPQLAVWKIGDRERFIPTPQAAPKPAIPIRPQYTSTSIDKFRTTDSDSLRQALLLAANETTAGTTQEYTGSKKTRAKADQTPVARPGVAYEFSDAPVAAAPPPPPAPTRQNYAKRSAEADSLSVSESVAVRGSTGSYVPSESISFGAPRGWQTPYFAGDLPASLAGGYTFIYPSARAESIRSGGETRRVALYSKRFPATPFLKILPALSKQAFLVAEMTNDGEQPLLGGQAHLFVGADLVGDAMLPTTAKGQKITLPLGVDDAIRIERNVNTVASQRGVFSKQEVNGYQVVIELLNPRSKAVKARVIDQVPLATGKDVEIALEKAEPQAKEDKTDGTLEWEVELPAGQKKTLTFVYSVAHPKDSKLWQRSEPAVNH